MRSIFSFIALICFINLSFAQNLTTPVGGGSPKAWVGERIGITDIHITYNRPGVKGRDGKVWGELVPYGYADLGFGTSKAAPWRAGADENTTISFSTDVQIEDKKLPAGIYGFFIAMSETDAELIFSKNTTSWGSYFYDPKEDALKVKVKTEKNTQPTERLKYEFTDQNDNSAVVSLYWEKMKIPFKVKVDLVQTQLESFRKELRGDKGFNPDAWVQAAAFNVQHNINLEEALAWSDYAINAVFVGQKNFKTLSGKANVLRKLGRISEADALMKEAMPLAGMQELHQYARQLLRDKRCVEALEVYKLNAAKNPNQFTTNVGLARGYSATGDFKNAMKYAKLAELQAPDKTNKDAVAGFIIKLQQGKDIN